MLFGMDTEISKAHSKPNFFLFYGLGYSFQLFIHHNTVLLTTVLLSMMILYKAYETGSKSTIKCFTLQELP